MLALTALDAAAHLHQGPPLGLRAKAGLALAGASALGLAHMVRQSRRAVEGLEEALVEGLGVDYVEQLDAGPTRPTWRRRGAAWPARSTSATRRVRVIRNLPYTEAGRRGHLDIYLPAGERRHQGRARAAPGPRRRLDRRRQGAPGPSR